MRSPILKRRCDRQAARDIHVHDKTWNTHAQAVDPRWAPLRPAEFVSLWRNLPYYRRRGDPPDLTRKKTIVPFLADPLRVRIFGTECPKRKTTPGSGKAF